MESIFYLNKNSFFNNELRYILRSGWSPFYYRVKRFIFGIGIRIIFLPLLKVYAYFAKPKRNTVRVIIRNGNDILLTKHTYYTKHWVLPGGGVNKNETPEHAAIRESKEEVGLNIGGAICHGSFEWKAANFTHTLYAVSGFSDSRSFRVDDIELGEAKWFALNELPDNLSPLMKKCLSISKLV